MFSHSKLVALLGLFAAAYCLNFSTVYEWNGQFEGDYKFSAVIPRYIAVYKNKMILSLESHVGTPSTLAWLRTDAPTKPPKLYSFQSLPKQMDRDNCITVQSAQGIEVDPFDQLWVVDSGWFCPAKLLIINLADDNKMKHVHVFPNTVVSHSYSKRWLQDMVLDESDNDFFAYIVKKYSKHLVVFSLKEKKSWRVEVEDFYIEALALSPLKMRQQLYLTEAFSKNILSISVSDLRKGAKRVKPTIVAMKASESNRMIMDEKGVLYFDLPAKKSIAMYDTNSPFKEEYIYKDEGVEVARNSWPFSFTIDACGDMWLIVRYKSNRKPQMRILKAAVGTRSYLYKNVTVSNDGLFGSIHQGKASKSLKSPSDRIISKIFPSGYFLVRNGTCDINKQQSLLVMNIVLSCWNLFNLLLTAVFLIIWYWKIKMTIEREELYASTHDSMIVQYSELPDQIFEEIELDYITDDEINS